jgi:hypothetical protein
MRRSLNATALATKTLTCAYVTVLSEWTVHESSTQPGDATTLEFADQAVRYSVNKTESGGSLAGRYITADDHAVPIKIEFEDESVTKGRFLLGRHSVDDADATPDWHSLFAFNFARLPNLNVVSTGVWSPLAAKAGWYQFVITSDRTFVLTSVVGGRTRVLEGLKFVPAAEQSFFQKYGMMLLMFAFMLVTQVMKNRMAPAAPAAAPAPGTPNVQAAPRVKKA